MILILPSNDSTTLPSSIIFRQGPTTTINCTLPSTMRQQRKTYIVGVGMTKYEKPRNRIGYEELGLQAAAKALLDAGVK